MKIDIEYKGRSLVTMVDTEDWPRVRPHRWYAIRHQSGDFYAIGTVDGKKVPLHRLVMDAPPGRVVDHMFHNTLDNRKKVLRVVTNQQNILNRRGPAADNKSSGARGVSATSYNPNRFQARVKVNGKSIYLGVFANIHLAAEAVKRKLGELDVPGHD